MDYAALDWAFSQHVSSGQKLMLIALARARSPESKACAPTHDTLATFCGMGRTTVKSTLKDLEVLGLVKIQARSVGAAQISNQYWLNLGLVIQPPAGVPPQPVLADPFAQE